MALGKHRRAVGIFPTRNDAEVALHELRDSGFPMDRVSVVVRDADKHDDIAGADVSDNVGNKADDGAKTGALTGGALGGLTGLLVGLGALAIPGIGPVMLAGATATTIATTISGGLIGAVSGGIIGALIGLGIPEERARVYNERVSRGQYLVIVDGSDDEIARAEAILRNRGIEEFGIYDIPGADVSPEYVTPVASTPVTGVSPLSNKQAIGYFNHYQDAQRAIAELREDGFPLNQISLVGERFDRREPFAGIELLDRFNGSRLGLPEERTRYFSDRIKRGDYVVIVRGTEAEIRRAAVIFNNHRIQEWHIYDPTAINTSVSSDYVAPTPGIGLHRRAVGILPNRRAAETALGELRDSGFPMDRVSLIAKDDHKGPIAGTNVGHGNKADEGAKTGAATGGVLGGLTGLLVGLGTLAIPGFGPVILAGTAATTLATTLAGGAIGAAAGGLGGALIGLGVPEDRARHYNERIARGGYLLIVDGTEEEIRRAESILNRWGVEDWGIYDAPRTRVSNVSADRDPLAVHTPSPLPTPAVGTGLTGVGAGVAGVAHHRQRRAVGVLPNRRAAETALGELRDSGFSMDRVSLIAKDDHQGPIGGTQVGHGNKADEGAKTGAATGGVLGGLTGLLVGLGTLALPGIGPVLLAGTAATTLATTLAGGAIGAAAGGLGGALIGLGVPEDRARHYNERIARGGYLLIVDGTEEEIRRAESILNRWGVEDWGIYDAPDADVTRSQDYPTRAVEHQAEVQTVDHEPKVIIVDHRNEVL
ncbi:general stress protein [Gloeothece verrucosa]|uniref:General stress protein 17M-like domain-containing protein n=1 Tax=Gloeothece verrucosa (strain PCC 7822) TaxID=497965 RepID=E0UHJ5_GLOV7|nr:general stress protein [Gloeothece verrucosa]ADN12136.1 hypothetical protein Cyan7822_0084 [Gloeothece verrucosa PCC 7822]